MNTVAKPGGARGDYKKLFKAYFETFFVGGRGLIRQKIKPVNQKQDFKE